MDNARIHLRVESLSKYFGPLAAVDQVSPGIQRGSITGLIDPNGAGKSTLFDTLASETQADSGNILINGKALRRRSANQVFRQGLARTFQIPQPFPLRLSRLLIKPIFFTLATLLLRRRVDLTHCHEALTTNSMHCGEPILYNASTTYWNQ